MTTLSTIAVLASVSAALSASMAIAWLVWYRTRNSGWVDTIWTIGVGSTGCIGALWPFSSDWTSRQIAVAAFITVWGFRLAAHLAYRTSGITDDPRYANLVVSWGKDAQLRMFSLLQKQALVSIPLPLAVVAAAWSPAPGLRAQDVLGLCILIVAIAGETLADHQLREFGRDPNNKRKICDRGLWAWSRHPNYFFQWLGWCAYPLLAIDPSANYPLGYAALGAPLCMYWLLNRVSGIPPLEQHMLQTRGEGFRRYQARTSAFFPLPPRTA